jgi:hypothetical protein
MHYENRFKINLEEMLISFLKQCVKGGLSLNGKSVLEMKISMEKTPKTYPNRFVEPFKIRNPDLEYHTVQGEVHDVKIAVLRIVDSSCFICLFASLCCCRTASS